MCPFCNARFSDAPARADAPAEAEADAAAPDGSVDEALPPPRQNSHLLQLPPAPMVIMGGAPARAAERRRGLWLLVPALLLAGLVTYGVRARGVPLPSEGLEAVATADVLPCGDAPDCVVIYLTPWDPASATTVELIDELRAAWADDGPVIEVVVGSGERDASLRLARAVRGSSWLDIEGSLPAAFELETVPAWLRVVDGRVVRRVDGTYLPLERQLEALGLPAVDGDPTDDERRVLTGEPARRPVAPADGDDSDDGEEVPVEDAPDGAAE